MKLLFSKRFLPFFISQFFGAFNDNIYKNAVLIFFSMTVLEQLGFYTNIAMALFISPMFLFSAWSGQLAENFPKNRLIVWIKMLEVLIVFSGIFAFMAGSKIGMIATLFLFGLQSTFFGPVKYSILPEQLEQKELMHGTGLVEAGTFIAILLGTLLGSYLIADERKLWLYAMCLGAALIGFITALFIPKKCKGEKSQKLPPFKPIRQTIQLLNDVRKQGTIFYAILAISWFWLLGGMLLTQIPQIARDVLGTNAQVITYLLVLSSLGISLGSVLASKLSYGYCDNGLEGFGAVFLLGFLFWLVHVLDTTPVVHNLNFKEFYQTDLFWPISLSLLGVTVSGGIYIVPLYTILQQKAEEGKRSKAIAANNIINSLFLVVVSLFSAFLLSVLKISLSTLFLIIAIMHVGVTIYIVNKNPYYILSAIAKVIVKLCYRFKVEGRNKIPHDGGCVVICNHVAYMDALMLIATVKRPMRFVVYHHIYNNKCLNALFRFASLIPIAPPNEDMKVFKSSFKAIAQSLDNDEIVMIFPEGSLTRTGKMKHFQRGVELILRQNPVPVVPMYLHDLWGSFFSHSGKGVFKGIKGFRPRVHLSIADPVNETSAQVLEGIVRDLGDEEKLAD